MPVSIAVIPVGVPNTDSIVPLLIDDVIVLGSELTANGMNEKVTEPTSTNAKYWWASPLMTLPIRGCSALATKYTGTTDDTTPKREIIMLTR